MNQSHSEGVPSRPWRAMLLGFVAGFAAALIYCWIGWVRPMQVNLDGRDQSLQEWARMNLAERESLTAVKNASVDELRTWVATLSAQNERFAELERRLHQQELELAGPATTYLLLAACVVVGVISLVVYWLRDSNQAAVTTLENLAAIASGSMPVWPCQPLRNAEEASALPGENGSHPALSCPTSAGDRTNPEEMN
jgi:hypothetical protein